MMAVSPHVFSHLSNIEKMKAESVWSDEQSRWKVPDLVVQKTKLPPAGQFNVSSMSSWQNSLSALTLTLCHCATVIISREGLPV